MGSCNYMTSAVEDCGNMLMKDGCNTQEEVNEMKDHQMEGILHQLQQSVEEWDTDKCPVVKAHVESKNPPAEVEAAAQKEEEIDNNNEEEGDNQDKTEETEGEDDTEDNNEEDGGEEDNGDGDQGEVDNPEETEDGGKAEEDGGNKDEEDGGNEEENGDGETDGDDDIEGKIGAAPSLAASIAVMAGLLMISIA